MDAALNRLVRERAGDRCECCQVPQACDARPFEVDHIRSRKHRGLSTASNLALSCFRCNSFKGSDIAGLDDVTGRLTPLFHPRRQRWERHFRWQGARLIGLTPVGRVTVALLRINEPLRVEVREGLVAEGVFPPPVRR